MSGKIRTTFQTLGLGYKADDAIWISAVEDNGNRGGVWLRVGSISSVTSGDWVGLRRKGGIPMICVGDNIHSEITSSPNSDLPILSPLTS